MAEHLERLLRSDDRPKLIFVVTVANHAPYCPDGARPARSTGVRFLNDPPALSRCEIENYLDRLRTTCAVIEGTIRNMQAAAAPFVFVQFGDHQPPLEALKVADGSLRPEGHYLTYYSISTNAPGATLPEVPVTDIAFLPVLAFDSVGFAPPGVFDIQRRLFLACHGRTLECQDPRALESILQELKGSSIMKQWGSVRRK